MGYGCLRENVWKIGILGGEPGSLLAVSNNGGISLVMECLKRGCLLVLPLL